MKNSYEVIRKNGKAKCAKIFCEPLDNEEYRRLVEECYNYFSDLPLPQMVLQYSGFENVISDPSLPVTALVFIDGTDSISRKKIDLGNAVVVLERGNLNTQLYCGVLTSHKSIFSFMGTICENLRESEY